MTGLQIRGNTSEMTDREKTDLCFHLIDQGNSALKKATEGYIEFGEVLEKLIGRHGVWQHHAIGIKSKSEFVQDAFKLSLSMCDHIKRVSKKYKPFIGDRTITFTRLLNALPYVNKENIVDVLEQAEKHSPSDWRDDLKELKGKEIMVCFHSESELWERCKNPDCGKWLKKLS